MGRLSRRKFWQFCSRQLKLLSRIFLAAMLDPTPSPRLDRYFASYVSTLICEIDQSFSNPLFQALADAPRNDGVIRQLQTFIAQTWHTMAARIIVTGSTGGAAVAIGGVLSRYCSSRRIALVDCLAHQSTTLGLIIGGFDAVTLEREISAPFNLPKPMTAAEVQRLMAEHGPENIAFVAYTAPSYDGFRNRQEEKKIYDLCNRHNIPVLIDGAWGASHGLWRGFPTHIHPYSDICLISGHKKGLMPSPLGAILFMNGELVDLFDRATDLGFSSTTSPPYHLLMCAETRLMDVVEGRYDIAWQQTLRSIAAIRNRVGEVHAEIAAVSPDDVDANLQDPCHILLHLGDLRNHVSGYQWAEALYANHGRIVEKATEDTILLLIGLNDADQENVILQDLRSALTFILHQQSSGDR